MQAVQEFQTLKSHAEAIQNDAEHEVATVSDGDAWAQGDVMPVAIPAVPKGATRIARPLSQLAPGTTQGSRHCLRSLDGVTLYVMPDATVLDGPVIDAPEGCAVDHPEHGNVILPPGVYVVIYQRAYADELQRVQD